MSTNVPIDVAAALRGWKQIAAYLHRDVRTVQRWERNEHLPVHRQLHLKLGTVHAVRGELDEWLADQTSPRAGTQTPFPTRDPRAYELCLKGRQLFHQFRRTSFERAREMFNRAIALDPECAIAIQATRAVRYACSETQGLIKLNPEAGILATTQDITANPKNLVVKELDAGIVGRSIDDLDAAVVNTDWALKSGLTPSDRIATEAVEKQTVSQLHRRQSRPRERRLGQAARRGL